jgi:outer membrane protein
MESGTRNNQTVQLAILLALLFVLPLVASGQESIIDAYIRTGLENNITIRRMDLTHEKNIAALREARGYFLPGFSFNARYTIARGGRTFDFPAGDMLNPLFQNITALNNAMAAINPLFPAIDPYPAVENLSFRFYRPREHETKFTIIQPLFNPAIFYNYKIKKVEAEMGLTGIEISRRSLSQQITGGYYDYLRSWEYDRLADEVLLLATENLRVCNSLFSNDIITRDVLYRAEADLAEAKMKKAEAYGAVRSSAAMFNFLLNRDLNAPIIRDTTLFVSMPFSTLDEALEGSALRRPEITLMDSWLAANSHHIKLTRADALPVIAGAADYGFQGEKYRFDANSDFMLASIVLRWNIYAGSTVRNKTRQALLDREILEANKEELQKQIELQIITSFYNLQAAFEAAESAASAITPATASFTLTRSRFREGLEPYAALMEAQTMMVKANQEFLNRQYIFKKEEAAYRLAVGNISFK